jgi:hypothetical protein
MMVDDLIVFRELILWIWQTHEKPWGYSNQNARRIVESNNLHVSSFSSGDDLEANLPSANNVSASFGSRHLYLTPVTQSRVMVPRIQMDCDFGRYIPEVRFRLELFLLNDNAQLQSLGYRFESPEGSGIQDVGAHHYYHIQLIQSPPSMVDWLPDTQPAFPIDADDPVKLLLGILLSLYGLDYLGEVLRDAHNIWGLDGYINGIPRAKFGQFEWYKLIEIGDPVKHIEGYKITSNLEYFDDFIHGKYAGCRIKGITRSAFEALGVGERKTYPH